MKEENKPMMEAHHEINGVATDLLIHIDELIENDSDIDYWAEHLSKRCNISIEEARKLIENNLS